MKSVVRNAKKKGERVSNHKILVIDDDPKLASLLVEYLEGRGLLVEKAANGLDGLERRRSGSFDLIVLDVMMPGMDGFTVLKELRKESQIPVIMLTARTEDFDRIVGLELGADDYLNKPFNPRELLARIHAILRRSNPKMEAEVLSASGIRMEIKKRKVWAGEEEVDLTATEFDLLRVLLSNAGRVIARERMMELARGQDFAAFDRSIDVHISNLRKKLGDSSKRSQMIKTIRGVGYLIPC
jgi:two-component system response regulator CpxR